MQHDTPWLTLLEVTGEDREDFLQGQLTQDLRTLTATAPVRFAASCDPKGRVLAVLTLVRFGDRLLAALRADRADDWLAHILRYRLRARVEIAPCESHRIVALATPADWSPLEPRHDFDATEGPPAWGIGPITETLLPRGSASPDATLDETSWRRARLRAGIADVGPAAAGDYTPHMLNLDRIGAISFRKGCYTGQEVVARTEHLGTVKRRARGVVVVEGMLEEGAALNTDGRSIGRIAVAAGDTGLAVMPEPDPDAAFETDDGRSVRPDG